MLEVISYAREIDARMLVAAQSLAATRPALLMHSEYTEDGSDEISILAPELLKRVHRHCEDNM